MVMVYGLFIIDVRRRSRPNYDSQKGWGLSSFRKRKSVVKEPPKVNVVRNAGTDVEFIMQRREERLEDERRDLEALEMTSLEPNSMRSLEPRDLEANSMRSLEPKASPAETAPAASCWSNIDMKQH